ncbi:MAG TPA: RNA 2',3'-cyclic phosphodiesterase [Candidatus Portnoybacteria bacterium]|nr:RNA 2',3'-cyclic phosphodiesterase [Candidatus Portnoybacteria bacterium]
MRKRLFIAINLPEKLKKYLDNLHFKWAGDQSIRWVKPENIHLTLIFLGYLEINYLSQLIRAGQKSQEDIINQLSPLEIKLDEATLGPNFEHPRLIWVKIHPNPALEKMRNLIVNNLRKEDIPFQEKHRRFIPHLTLARLNHAPRNFESEKISWQFPVKSFELMESRLQKSGAEYDILNRFTIAG